MDHKKDGPKTNKKRVRRNRTEEILEEATKLFGMYGFQGTTLAMIADAVGLTEPGILHYFPSKVHLLQEVLNYHDKKDFEKYSELMGAEKKDAAELFQMLEGFLAENEKMPELIQLFTVLVGESIRSEHPSHDFFVERYRQGREIYTRQFLSLLKTEIRPDVDLDELATLIMAVTDGLRIQRLLDPESVNLTTTFKLFANMVATYLDA